jgi:hypothetical protein
LIDKDTTFTFCPGVESCYDIEFEDEEYASGSGFQAWKDTIEISWTNVLPGATFTPNDPGFVFKNGQIYSIRKGKLCWNPKISDSKQIPYLVTVMARDRACPINATASKSFFVNVNGTDTTNVKHIFKPSFCGGNHELNLKFNTADSNIKNYDIKTTISPIHNPDSVLMLFDTTHNSFRSNLTGKFIVKTQIWSKLGEVFCDSIFSDSIYLLNNDSLLQIYGADLQFNIISPKFQCFKTHSFSFEDTSQLASASLVKRIWYLNNDSLTNAINPTGIKLNNPGIYTLQLKKTYGNGCIISTDTQQIYIENPLARIHLTGVATRCLRSQQFRFHNTSISNFPFASKIWHASDSIQSTDSIFIVSFNQHGSKTVTQIVEGVYGCKDTSTLNVTVNPHPESDFELSASEFCRIDTLKITNKSSITSGSISSQSWIFGEGAGSNAVQPPPRVYNNANTYNIRLINVSNNSCRDTLIKSVTINPMPTVNVGVNSASQCFPGHSFALNAITSISSGSIDSVHWNLGDGSTSFLSSLNKTYADTGIYNTMVTVYSNKGCKASASRNLITLHKVLAAFVVNQTSQCQLGNLFEFTDVSSVITSDNKIWHFGDGTASTAVHANKSYPNVGTYEVSLITNRFGVCADTFKRTIFVNPKPVAAAISGPPIPANNGGSNFLYSTTNQPNHTYFWTLTGGQIVSGQNTRTVMINWADSGFQNVSYEITNSSNCKDTSSLQVYVDYVASLEDIALQGIRIYPNPVKDLLYFESKSTVIGVKVYDNKGSIVIQSGENTSIDFKGLATGLYIIKLTDIHGKVLTGKIIKE